MTSAKIYPNFSEATKKILMQEKKVYTILYNNGEYSCQLIESNNSPSDMGGHTSDYLNVSDSIHIYKSDFQNKNYLIKKKMERLDWNITEETKTINGRLCVKATLKKVAATGRDKNYVVVAWFTPEIPFTFGPIGYYGLPGAIVRLETPSLFYTLKDFAYTDNIKIEIPKEGMSISEQDFYDILNKQWEEWVRTAK